MQKNVRRNVRGRDPVKREEMLAYIRGKIWNGEWNSGDVLPPRTCFEEIFQAAPVTAQRTFQILLDQGLLTADRRRGTRVCENLPHLTHYAIALSGSEKQNNKYSKAILNAAEILKRRDRKNIESFFVMDYEANPEESKRLCHLVENRLVAGIFFTSNPHYIRYSPIVTLPGIPRAAFASPDLIDPWVLPVFYDGLIEKSLTYIAEHGGKKIAMFLPRRHTEPEKKKENFALLSELGLQCRKGCYLECNINTPAFAEEITHLLFSPDNSAPPDTVYVGDDNFLDYVLAAIHFRYGADAPQKVRIVSHANFPQDRTYDFPVKFFGLDVVSLLEDSFHAMDLQNRGQTPKPITAKICEDAEFYSSNIINNTFEKRRKA